MTRKKCPMCAAWFDLVQGTQIYCSQKCRNKRHELLNRPPKKIKRCANPECQKPFTVVKNQVYCASYCRQKINAKRFQKQHPEKVREYVRAWQARNPTKHKEHIKRSNLLKSAKLKAANQILKWAKEQGVYNG